MAQYFASLNFLDLLGRLPAGVAQGLIWGIMALGVYITFRLLDIADLSVDGTFSTGGAVTVILILAGVDAMIVILVAIVAGLAAGEVVAVVKDANGAYWALGMDEPATASAGEGATGTARGDGNHYSITLLDNSVTFPYEVSNGEAVFDAIQEA